VSTAPVGVWAVTEFLHVGLGDVPTVQRPNSVAVDPRWGGVLVTGSDPGGASNLQIVTPDLLPTG
jgi:hypothetical protein